MKDQYFIELGASIAHYRKLKGFTQQQLADRLHISRGTVANWETARIEMNVKQVLELCEVLGITSDELCQNAQKYLWRNK